MAIYKVYETFINGSIFSRSYDNLKDAEERFDKSLELFHECMHRQYNNIYADVWQTIARDNMHYDTVKAVLTKVEDNKETVLKIEGIEYNYVKKEGNDINSEEEKNKLREITQYFEGKVEIL